MREDCIKNLSPPDLAVGALMESGKFIRNLKKSDVVKRYQGDDDENPVYGFKIQKRHWKSAATQGHLSVNLLECVHSEECSIAIHPDAECNHVAIVDLDSLNSSGYLKSRVVAQYKPEDPNKCHFELAPLDGTVLSWMELLINSDEPFPPASKIPSTEPHKTVAFAEYQRYRLCFEIKRWVKPRAITASTGSSANALGGQRPSLT